MVDNCDCGNEFIKTDKKFYYLEKDTLENDRKYICRKLSHKTNEIGRKVRQKRFYMELLFKRFPILNWLFIEYKIKNYLLTDLVTGLTVGIMNMPQCMAYALLANLGPTNGLYMSVFPILMYTILGTSKHLFVGAVAVMSLLSGEIIQDLADNYKQTMLNQNQNFTLNGTDEILNKYKVTIACSLSLFVGLVQILMGLTGLGVLSTYFHDTFISAYTCGSTIHAIVTQIKDLLGLSNTTRFNGLFKIPKTVFDLAKKIKTINLATTLVSVVCIIYLVLFKEFINPRIRKRIKIAFPSELFLVIGISCVSYMSDFNESFGIAIVKDIPKGMPKPSIPSFETIPYILKEGIILSLIGFSTSISLAKVFSRKNKYKIDPTQELYAYGTANLFSSFFGCYPSCGSLSRTALNDSSGSKSQISSLASAFIILLVILWLGPFFEPLPKACLASIIIVALKSMVFQIKDVFRLWMINKCEAIIWILTFLSVVFLDVDLGLIIGLVVSAFLIVIKDQNDLLQPLAKYTDQITYVDPTLINLQSVNDIPSNIKIMKIKKSLYYANIETFINKISELSDYYQNQNGVLFKIKTNNKISNNEDETDLKEALKFNKQQTKSYLLLDFTGVNYVDLTAVKSLHETLQNYAKTNFRILICGPQKHFIKMLNNMDIIELFDGYLFVTINEALNHIISFQINK